MKVSKANMSDMLTSLFKMRSACVKQLAVQGNKNVSQWEVLQAIEELELNISQLKKFEYEQQEA